MDFGSTVRLMGDVPLTPAYNDTFAFPNIDAQKSYFSSRTAQTFTNMSYVKSANGGQVVLPVTAMQYKRFNYMAYTNPDYPGKWFYAFIISCEYVADGSTLFTFVDDPIQTWMYEILPVLGKTFIIRQHVNDDVKYRYYMDEGLSVGDYVCAETVHAKIDKWWIVVASTIDLQGFDDSVGAMYSRVYSGLTFRIFSDDESGVSTLNSVLAAVAKAGKIDSIVSIYMVPRILFVGGTSGETMPSNTTQLTVTIPDGDSLNGYHPKNNKMYCYPFTALRITNSSGQSQILKYEWLGEMTLSVGGSPFPDGRVLMWPTKYKYRTNNFDFAINVGDFPQCSWIKDVYSNWLATQSVRWQYAEDRRDLRAKANISMSLVNGSAGIGMSQMTEPNMLAGAQAAIGAAGNLLGTLVQNHISEEEMKSRMAEDTEVMSMTPPGFGGTVGNSSTLVSMGNYGYTIERITCGAEYAMACDDYMSMNGYKRMRIEDIHIFGRPYWNYVKTMNVTINGSCSDVAKRVFERCLNAGIRFWHTEKLGDYSLDNSN